MRTSEQVNELFDALSAAQGELTDPEKNKTAEIRSSKGSYSYNYADIADVLGAARPVLSKHGLCVIQATVLEGDHITLRTRLAHKSGQWMESDYPVCSRNGDHKSMGGAMTYARRYSFSSLIGIAAVDDIDGEGAAKSGEGPTKPMSANEAKDELDWEAIQASIDNAPTQKKIDQIRERIKLRKDWPASYQSMARERCDLREAVIKWRDENTKLFDQIDGCETFDEVDEVVERVLKIMADQNPAYGAEVTAIAEKRKGSIAMNAGKLV